MIFKTITNISKRFFIYFQMYFSLPFFLPHLTVVPYSTNPHTHAHTYMHTHTHTHPTRRYIHCSVISVFRLQRDTKWHNRKQIKYGSWSLVWEMKGRKCMYGSFLRIIREVFSIGNVISQDHECTKVKKYTKTP